MTVDRGAGGGVWLKSKLRGVVGRFVLTDRRMVFAETGIPALGLLGLLFNKEGTVRVQAAKSDFAGIDRGSHGRAKHVVNVKISAGETFTKGLATPYEDWEKALKTWAA
jgi:hypothetical protein